MSEYRNIPITPVVPKLFRMIPPLLQCLIEYPPHLKRHCKLTE